LSRVVVVADPHIDVVEHIASSARTAEHFYLMGG